MGRRSKAVLARLGNLPEPQKTQKTTVEHDNIPIVQIKRWAPFHFQNLYLADLIAKLRKSSCPIYQRIQPGFKRSRSSIGQPKIPRTPYITRRNGCKAESWAPEEVSSSAQFSLVQIDPCSVLEIFFFFSMSTFCRSWRLYNLIM
jgi:hypothetical protein